MSGWVADPLTARVYAWHARNGSGWLTDDGAGRGGLRLGT
jgi:hypothetical protein